MPFFYKYFSTIWLYLINIVILFAINSMNHANAEPNELLHVKSPDWRDQIIYFVMTDRFQDGDKSNNDHGYGLYRPTELSFYNGGDLQGIIEKLDYIKGLGATTLWLTPPVANVWWNPATQSTGYHGYWARNFKQVDERIGNLSTYKKLSSHLHKNGMFLIQDIVANHVGNYFYYEGEYDPLDTKNNFKILKGVLPTPTPTQAPFHLINRLNEIDNKAGIYHWTPEINNFYDRNQEFTFQLSELSDLNTSNAVVRDALKDSFNFWIEEVGVDGYRLDTGKYLEPEFLHEFLHAKDGLLSTAAKMGKDNFPVFAEIFETSLPYSDTAEKKIRSFQGTNKNLGVNGLIGFPLYKSIEDVFRSGQATDQLSYRIMKQMEIYQDPYLVLNFIDNHDVKRFNTGSNTQAVKQALAFIMTVPGIPTIYQGDEQGLLEPREAMFAGGYHAHKDKFDTTASLYKFIQELTSLRKKYRALSRGSIEILADSKTGAGVLAYKRATAEQTAIVIFNTADHPVLLANLQTGIKPTESLSLIFNKNIKLKNTSLLGNALTLRLPARAMAVFIVENKDTNEIEEAITIKHTINNVMNGKTISVETMLTGSSTQINTSLLLVENGNLDTAKTVFTNNKGQWSSVIAADDYGEYTHSVEIYDQNNNIASNKVEYTTINNEPNINLSFPDPVGDDFGPTEDYKKPEEKSFDQQMDITKVSIKSGGRSLNLVIEMAELRTDWVAANGFDHVAFSLFFDIPGIKGQGFLPKMRSKTPNDFSWNFGHIAYGWGNTVFNTKGASTTTSGKTLPLSPKLTVDLKSKTIHLQYDAAIFGIDSWENTKVFISTWDVAGEGDYRALNNVTGRWSFYSQNNADGAYILDSIGPLSIVTNSIKK